MMRKEENKEPARSRLMWYLVRLKESIQGIDRHGSLHLFGNGFAWYVYPYRKLEEAKKGKDTDSRRICLFWNFMDGDRSWYSYFYDQYLRALRQLLWMNKTIGFFELASVPKSDPEAKDPLREICKEIVQKETFILCSPKDGTDLLCRTRRMVPVHRGGKYNVKEIEGSLDVTRPLHAPVVIMIDDMVFSGKTIAACKRVLKKAGARRVYAICLYGYRRQ